MSKSKRGKRKTHSTHGDRSGGVDFEGQQVTVKGDVAGRDIVKQEAPVVGIVGLHQLPPPPRDFTGRTAELDELLAQAEGEGVTISGLRGMGGVGKTALALVLADKLKERYPDAQFYLDLKGASQEQVSVAEALSHVVRAYHPTAQLPAGEDELRGLYQSVLHGQRALLLMDNAADKWQVEPLMPPSSCFLLVTSRQHFTLPGLHVKNLDTLPPDDARDLLLKIAPRLDSPLPISGEAAEGVGVRAADAMAKLCGYLPLALRLAGGVMTERVTLTPEDYLRRLGDARKRLELIDASLSLSYDLLSEELQQAWCALSVFPDTFDLAAAAAVWDVDQDQAQDWLGELVRYSLVEWDALPPPTSGEGRGGGRARLHDLARLFADARLGDDERIDSQRRHAAHYRAILAAADDLYLEGGENVLRGLALFDLERTNIEAGQAWAAEHADADDAAAGLCSDYPDAGAYVLDLRHHPREIIRWREVALAAARRLKQRSAEGAHLGNLGLAYTNLGETRRAIELHEQHLTIAREIGYRRGEGTALDNLGLAYRALGEYSRAIEYHEQNLTIAREIGDRQGEGTALGNLGTAYYLLGVYRRAIRFHKLRLTITREMGDRRGEGAVLGNLGSAYYSLGEYRRAIEYHEQALAIAQQLGDRRVEGTALGNLGNACSGLRDRQGAIMYFQQALAIAREIGDRAGEGRHLWNMADEYEMLGYRAQAIRYAKAALVIFEQIESPHADTARKALAEWRGQQ